MKKNTKQNRLVLLDAHAILHRAYHALPEFSSSKGEPTGALYGLSTMLIKIITDLKPDYLAACYDLPGPTYRHEAYEAYKGQRKKTDDQLVLQMDRSRDVFKAFSIPMYDLPGFEADDMLGTIVEQVKKIKDLDVIIASGDMDTMQLIVDDKVRVYTLKKGINDTILYNEEAVRDRFGFGPELLPDYKGLRGDPSDNIVGIKGVGEKTAEILISTFGTLENMYKVLKKNPEKIKAAGVSDRMVTLLTEGEEEAMFSKMLATIRRDAPITFTLPDTKWSEHFDRDKATALFADLDFRTLGARLKNIGAETIGAQGSLIGGNETEEEKKPEIDIPKKEWEDLAIAVWVLNSNVSNPELEDIYRVAGTKNLEEARKILTEKIQKEGLQFVYEKIEKPLIPIIEEMEKCGIKVDKKYLETLSKNYHKELSKLEKSIWSEYFLQRWVLE
jgi:DNA polymerase I